MSMQPERWDELLRTNVTGPWLVTRAALPLMLQDASARVVYLTSEAGWAFTPGFGAYNATKSALNNLGASFAAEIRSRAPALFSLFCSSLLFLCAHAVMRIFLPNQSKGCS
jgi:3-oxoacyl-[acyl-carrier protein] reductase